MHRLILLAALTAVALTATAHAASPLTTTRATSLVEREARAQHADLGSYVRATCKRTGPRSYTCRYVVADGVTCGMTDNADGTYRGRATVTQRAGYAPRAHLTRPRPTSCPETGAPRP